jgi:cystathionine gamma-synthase
VRPGDSGAVATGIEVSTTFSMERAGEPGEFDYARAGNPTRGALEEALAVAEGGRFAMAFSSGLAAIDAVLRLVGSGGTVVIGSDAYGGTWRLLQSVYRDWGLSVQVVDMSDGDAVRSAVVGASMVLVETPTNPTLSVVDIDALADAAHWAGALLVVDNTFATPWLQRPLHLGADVVVHSTTKYIGGHSDVVGGAVVVDDASLAERIQFVQKAVGAVPGPFDCFLALRGLRTLGLRMERSCGSAAVIADWLASRDEVASVLYPGRVDHPGHVVASAQMRGGGAMVSFTCARGSAWAREMVGGCEVFTLAESLGAVESLIEHPSSMTHQSADGSPLEVDAALVRLSVGIEDVGDLIGDLAAAFERMHI